MNDELKTFHKAADGIDGGSGEDLAIHQWRQGLAGWSGASIAKAASFGTPTANAIRGLMETLRAQTV